MAKSPKDTSNTEDDFDSPEFDEWVGDLWGWTVAATILVVVLRDFQG